MKQEWVEILTEEASMKNALEILLPSLLPDGYELNVNCFVRPHQGKSDLLKSLRRKVKAYPNFPLPVKLIVLHDQDSNDCIALKNRINGIIDEVNPGQPRLIRIACHELENWYLGDPDAIEQVYPTFKADRFRNRTIFRIPDRVVGSNELKRLIPDFAKTEASRIIPVHMNTTSNRSVSFGHFVSGVKRFLG